MAKLSYLRETGVTCSNGPPVIILHRSKFTVIKQPSRVIVMIFIVKNTPHPCCARHATTRLLNVTLERQHESASHGLSLCLHGTSYSAQAAQLLTLAARAARSCVCNYPLFSNCRKKSKFPYQKKIHIDNSIIFRNAEDYRIVVQLVQQKSFMSYFFDNSRK